VTISHLALAAAIAIAAGTLACAPAVDGPAERQRALDREDGARLAAQLAALPGVVRAEVVLRRAVRDPLIPPAAAPAPPGASVVAIVDDRADRAAIADAARTLLRPLAPDATPAILVEVGATRPRLAKVGPFTVEAASKPALQAALAAALGVIAALAAALAYLAWSARRRPGRQPPQRRGNSAQ
jgi:hypothetical protein